MFFSNHSRSLGMKYGGYLDTSFKHPGVLCTFVTAWLKFHVDSEEIPIKAFLSTLLERKRRQGVIICSVSLEEILGFYLCWIERKRFPCFIGSNLVVDLNVYVRRSLRKFCFNVVGEYILCKRTCQFHSPNLLSRRKSSYLMIPVVLSPFSHCTGYLRAILSLKSISMHFDWTSGWKCDRKNQIKLERLNK